VTSTPAPGRGDATSIGLRYVSHDQPGIERRRAGRGFSYLGVDGRPIRAADELARIRAIAIPPAWTEVWICPSPDGHLQATGRDARGRRQYRYHTRFRARRDRDKFSRLVSFGKALPRIRRQVRSDLARRGLPREKVVAAVVSLLETTRFRVGNAEYARVNRSFGVSTLRNRHATVSGPKVRLRFRGKGGRIEERTVVDRRLAAIVRRCQELPGQSLFQYVDEDGEERAISSEDVNAYLRDAAGTDEFSAKDFRTWTATVLAYRALRQTATAGRHHANPVKEAIKETAALMNDTVAVTRSSYVHPEVIAAFEPAEQRGAKAKRDRTAARTSTPDETAGRTAPEPPNRRDELAVLALLQRSARAASMTTSKARAGTKPARGRARPSRGRRRDATRSQVGGRRVAGRSSRETA
jgi:DNA topoisomerase I